MTQEAGCSQRNVHLKVAGQIQLLLMETRSQCHPWRVPSPTGNELAVLVFPNEWAVPS